MGNELTLNTIDFGCCFTWKHAQKMIDKEFGYRLPTIGEAIMLDFTHHAIWTSEEINSKQLVMDQQWGAQIVRDGAYGLILVEK